jgi:hypothetical protein
VATVVFIKIIKVKIMGCAGGARMPRGRRAGAPDAQHLFICACKATRSEAGAIATAMKRSGWINPRWNGREGRWALEPGGLSLLTGRSSAVLRLNRTLRLGDSESKEIRGAMNRFWKKTDIYFSEGRI